jgi:hypothetical protein
MKERRTRDLTSVLKQFQSTKDYTEELSGLQQGGTGNGENEEAEAERDREAERGKGKGSYGS